MGPIKRTVLCLIIAFNLNALPSFAEGSRIQGRVVGIHDGDTITILTKEQRTIKVRMAGIDAPELDQPYGQDSKKQLSNLIFSREVEMEQTDTDRYKRAVGKVYVNGVEINLKLVLEGAAWVYLDYNKDSVYIEAEQAARDSRNGLWALQAGQIIPPWEWRRAKRNKSTPIAPMVTSRPSESKTSDSFNRACGAKRYCKQMQSCEEARFYLNSCGLSRLDGDGDGIPCEAICR